MPYFKEYKGQYAHWAAKGHKPNPTGRIYHSLKRTDWWEPTKKGQTLSYKRVATPHEAKKPRRKRRRTTDIWSLF